MLAERTLFYYKMGYNCSKCLFKAYSDIYNVKLDSRIYKLSNVINNGFGIGNICSAAVAALIIISLHFDENKAKAQRIAFLDRYHEKFKNFNCSVVKKYGCEYIISSVGNILYELL